MHLQIKLGCCSLLYVRTSYVSHTKMLFYIVSAYLASYCLLVPQKQRFHQPTLKKTSVLLVGCIKKSNFTSNRVHCCIHVSRVFFWGGLGSSYIKTNISSSWVYQKQYHQQQACTLLYKQAYQQGAQPPWACS